MIEKLQETVKDYEKALSMIRKQIEKNLATTIKMRDDLKKENEEYSIWLDSQRQEIVDTLSEKINTDLEDASVDRVNEKIDILFAKIGLDVSKFISKIKAAITEPLPLVKYVINEVQTQKKSPKVETINFLREQIKLSITDKDTSTEVIKAIKALDNYTDNANFKDTLVDLRQLQWKLEELDKNEVDEFETATKSETNVIDEDFNVEI